MRSRIDIINSVAVAISPTKIMDIGCGACTVADIFNQHGHDVFVSDVTDRRVPDSWMPKFTKAAAAKAPLDKFNCVILAGLLYHLSTESQLNVCRRLAGKTVLLDTHYVKSEEDGEPRNRTESSQPLPMIPSIKFIRDKLFAEHFVLQTEEHTEDRSWFICLPKERRLH